MFHGWVEYRERNGNNTSAKPARTLISRARPAFTNLTVADHHDGTKTVTVTDNATAPSPATRPLGLDGSPPLS